MDDENIMNIELFILEEMKKWGFSQIKTLMSDFIPVTLFEINEIMLKCSYEKQKVPLTSLQIKQN